MKKIERLADLMPDPENANIGTERGNSMLENSLREFGAGRSILADKNGVVVAGNKTLEQAAALGLEIETVHTKGDRLIVVVRDDLDLQSDEKAKRLAIADNRISQVNLSWDTSILERLNSQDLLKGMWGEDEIKKLLTGTENGQIKSDNEKGPVICPKCGEEFIPE